MPRATRPVPGLSPAHGLSALILVRSMRSQSTGRRGSGVNGDACSSPVLICVMLICPVSILMNVI
jgi:hypothetical protein